MRLIMLKDLVSHSISPTLGDFGPQQWVQGAQHPPTEHCQPQHSAAAAGQHHSAQCRWAANRVFVNAKQKAPLQSPATDAILGSKQQQVAVHGRVLPAVQGLCALPCSACRAHGCFLPSEKPSAFQLPSRVAAQQHLESRHPAPPSDKCVPESCHNISPEYFAARGK